MPEPINFFRIAGEYFWLAAILLSFVNEAIMWQRSASHRKRDPSVADGYRSLARGFLIWWNIPWLVMGVGIHFGGVPSVFHYLNLKTSNPYIIAFAASIVFLWISGSFWLFARGGAEYLCRHPDFFKTGSTNPNLIKLFWTICVAGAVAAFAMMYFGQFTVPEFSRTA